ncbi:Hypothetical predicted protein [Mytilus galloprovincialis]|uniref:Reverse transcriptase domain-containing protein n=1 Tax=Mytilus galloprovincialis TaxID=29158 RepID=A0A8B6GJS4_MYTGA|nr:Hypothetical predicted protein [Mytilus galloprovincialis]
MTTFDFKASSPINCDQLEFELRNHPDRNFVSLLCNSVRYGFDMLVSDINISTYECKNALSAGKIQIQVSPIGIAVHKYSFKKRLILDLSSPHNSCDHDSVNDLIDKDLCSLSYIKVDDAINAIQDYGVNSICCKVDVCDAFKQLDDFLTVDRPTDCGERTMALLSLIFNKLSIPLSKKKTVGPSCVLEYLGIVLDTVNMQARLPQDKVKRITDFITLILSKKSCTRKELEQLLGHLNFATRVILPGRSFQQSTLFIAKGRSKETNIMKLMRKLIMCAATYNFAVCSEHLPRKSNVIADALSRLQMNKFRLLAPLAEATATLCPQLSDILWTAQ